MMANNDTWHLIPILYFADFRGLSEVGRNLNPIN